MKIERKPCEEWVEAWRGEPTVFDSHSWVESINTDRLQVLRCSVCGKHSTGNKNENDPTKSGAA